MKNVTIYLVFTTALLLFSGCGTTDTRQEEKAVYPMYVDENKNSVNDYVEQSTHEAGLSSTSKSNKKKGMQDQHFGERGHDFIDQDGDGICDYAQNGSPSWHGPGFVDDNNNGICDYWDSSHAMHRRHEGMRFHDENSNHINDYFERETHVGSGHNFTDQNGDGICDYAQDGSPTWHGPGFTDSNQNGTCDYWEEGGRGHGRGHGMGGGHH
ncbi:hypothetical protein [Fodinibius sediminis]|uniref:Lipoprotein n=1 Tax=Fodinibius sediminis TaxID=1214077 RepID=A0A521F0G6_9BACT|nr:hypothetical protein [Fodinibius sediminis]SMO89655.1 hypothetical protein SAMN06265218_12113 [Fodinibius sediminis]